MRDRWDTTRTDLAGVPAAESDPPEAGEDSVFMMARPTVEKLRCPPGHGRAQRVAFVADPDGHSRVRRGYSGGPCSSGFARPCATVESKLGIGGAQRSQWPLACGWVTSRSTTARVDEAFDGHFPGGRAR